MMEKEWTGTTYGNGWMHKWLIQSLRFIDVRLLYAFTSIFIIPVCLLLLHKNASYIYKVFRNRLGFSRFQSLKRTYINHCLFGQVVIDKFAMYAGKSFSFEVEGYKHYLTLARNSESFIFLSSHIGNYELAGYKLVSDDKPFNVLVYMGEKKSVMENRSKMFAHTNIHMISVKQDMSHLFEINNALRNGEIVSMPADRFWGSSKYLTIDFLGKNARFPLGPFKTATMRGVGVLAINVMKTSLKSYKIYVTPLCYDKTKSKDDQVVELANNYVRELEKMIKLYPCQWYNYYDFWKYED